MFNVAAQGVETFWLKVQVPAETVANRAGARGGPIGSVISRKEQVPGVASPDVEVFSACIKHLDGAAVWWREQEGEHGLRAVPLSDHIFIPQFACGMFCV